MPEALENRESEEITGTEPAETAELSLRDALAASFDEYDKPEGAEAAETPAPAETAAPAETKPEETPAEPAPTEAAVQPPATWNAADKAIFGKLPADAKAILARREKEITADYTRKTQEIAQLKKDYEPVSEMFKPYSEAMKSKGFTPSTMISAWMNVEKALVEGRGVEIIAGLVKNYNIEPAKIMALFNSGGAPVPSPQAPNGQAQQLPPELAAKLDQIDKRFKAEDDARAADAAAKRNAAVKDIETRLSTFAEAKNDKGELKNPYFKDVEMEMAALVASDRQLGRQPRTLDQLYESAVFANPTVRAKHLAAEEQARKTREIAAAKDKATKAKKAASSVSGAPSGGRLPASGNSGDLREQLESAYADTVGAI